MVGTLPRKTSSQDIFAKQQASFEHGRVLVRTLGTVRFSFQHGRVAGSTWWKPHFFAFFFGAGAAAAFFDILGGVGGALAEG